VLVHRERGQHEQLGRGGEPEGGEHARSVTVPSGAGRPAGAAAGPPRGAARSGMRAAGARGLIPGAERREKRVAWRRGDATSRSWPSPSRAGRALVRERFGTPTPAQAAGWPAIARGADTLIAAPTGSGKTLAAFLWSLDRLLRAPGRVGSRSAPTSSTSRR